MDKYDYKKFLLEELHDTRQEELIFWKKNIPMPVELVYQIFDKRGELLGKYIDHIASCFLYAKAFHLDGMDWLDAIKDQPNKQNSDRQDELKKIYSDHITKSGTLEIVNQVCDMFLLGDYEFSENRFVSALTHEGRKYTRLYIPQEIKKLLSSSFPELLNTVAKSNGDMFSNVVADELKIYRMGFADAFSGMFNKLVDFIIRNSGHAQTGFSSSSLIRVRQTEMNINSGMKNDRDLYDIIADGSLWEPVYVNAESSYKLNRNHPFCDTVNSRGKDAEYVFKELVAAMAETEDQIMRESERKVIETFRRDISRKLRLKIEMIS